MKVNAENRLPAAMDRTEAYALYAIFRDFAKQINYLTDAVAGGTVGPAGAQGQAGAALFLLNDPPEPEFQLPGPQGQAGPSGGTGATGATGPAGPALFFLDEAPDPEMGWPGARGETGPQGPAGGGGSLSTASIPFTNGDTVQWVTVTDGSVSATSKVHSSIRRPDKSSPSDDAGYIYLHNIVRVGTGEFDVQVVCLGLSGDDITENPPNETVTLTYSVA